MSFPADIVARELCTGCGCCVSEAAGAYQMGWDKNGFLVPELLNASLDKEDTLRVCPFNPKPDPAVADEDQLAHIYLEKAAHFHEKIGRYENTYIGYSQEFRDSSSSGGISTYIFRKLLEAKIVDYLFIVKEDGGTYKYQLVKNISDIRTISKTRYIPVTLSDLFEKIQSLDGRVGVSGVACFIKAIRLKQYYHPELRDKISFLVGIICGGLKSRFFTDYLAQRAGIEGGYHNQEYRIKDEHSLSSDYSFGAFDREDKFHQMKMREVGDLWGTGLFKSRACEFCTDVLTELADISLGDAWLDEYRNDGLGNSIIVTRSSISDKIIRDGFANGELRGGETSEDLIIKSQSSSFRHRHDGLLVRMRVFKLFGGLLPHVRTRVQKPVSLLYIPVQLVRLLSRKLSLKYWRETNRSVIFDKKMRGVLFLLHIVTGTYHRLSRYFSLWQKMHRPGSPVKRK